eukprot:12971158-Heterocapsa_arctica.AAC.1
MVTVGAPWSQEEFLQQARGADHPLNADAFMVAGDDHLRAIAARLTEGPTETRRKRRAFLDGLKIRAEQLR